MSDDVDIGNDMALQPIGNDGGGGCAMAKYEIWMKTMTAVQNASCAIFLMSMALRINTYIIFQWY